MNRIIIMCFLNKSCPKTGLKGTMTSVTDPIALIGYDPNYSNNAVYNMYTYTEFNSGCLLPFKKWIVLLLLVCPVGSTSHYCLKNRNHSAERTR